MDFKTLYQDEFYQRMSFSELLTAAKEREVHRLPTGLEKREIIRPLHRTFLDSVINHFKSERLAKPSQKDFIEVVPLAADHYLRNYVHLGASTTLTEMMKDLGADPGENWERVDFALEAYAKRLYQIYYYDIARVVEYQISKPSFRDELLQFGQTVLKDTGEQVNAYWAILYMAMLCQCRDKIKVERSIEYDFAHGVDGTDILSLMLALDSSLRKSGEYHVYVSFIVAYELFSRYFYMDQIISVFSIIHKYIKIKLV